MSMFEARVFTDNDNEPRNILHFTNARDALRFKRDVMNDEGLAGISKVTVDRVALDQDAVSNFWDEVEKESM